MKNLQGSESFLKLLKNELNKCKSPDDYKIATPSILSDIKKVNGVPLIARFDGITHYKFTPTSLYFFLKQRKFSFLPMINFGDFLGNNSISYLDRMLNRYLSRIEIELRKTADIIIYQSQFSKEMHEFLLGETNAKSVIIHNGISLKSNICAQYDEKEKVVNAAITAHFRLGKRLADAIRICNDYNNYHQMTLHIIGEIDMLTKESISNISLDNCIFYGGVDQSKAFEIYKNIHIGLASSINESCSNSILEMMSVGIPVIVSSQGGSKEIVPSNDFIVDENTEVNPCFIEYHNPYLSQNEEYYDRWVDKIRIIMSNHSEYSKITQDYVIKNHNIKLIASKYLDVINGL
jgi:glycosyltransferase involved in cell wall biosynthesis